MLKNKLYLCHFAHDESCDDRKMYLGTPRMRDCDGTGYWMAIAKILEEGKS